MAKAVAEARTVAETLRGSDPAAIARLIDQIVRRIDIAADAITITVDMHGIMECLDIGHEYVKPGSASDHGAGEAEALRHGDAPYLPDRSERITRHR